MLESHMRKFRKHSPPTVHLATCGEVANVHTRRAERPGIVASLEEEGSQSAGWGDIFVDFRLSKRESYVTYFWYGPLTSFLTRFSMPVTIPGVLVVSLKLRSRSESSKTSCEPLLEL